MPTPCIRCGSANNDDETCPTCTPGPKGIPLLSTGYLPRAEADEALKRLGELRHLIDEFNEWQYRSGLSGEWPLRFFSPCQGPRSEAIRSSALAV